MTKKEEKTTFCTHLGHNTIVPCSDKCPQESKSPITISSILEEYTKQMDCIDECKNGPYEDIGCPAHGIDSMKTKKFFKKSIESLLDEVESRCEERVCQECKAVGKENECPTALEEYESYNEHCKEIKELIASKRK